VPKAMTGVRNVWHKVTISATSAVDSAKNHGIRRHRGMRGFVLAVVQADGCCDGKPRAKTAGKRFCQLLMQWWAVRRGIHGVLRHRGVAGFYAAPLSN